MSEIGTAVVKVALDWSGVADDLRAMADRIDPQDHTAPLVSTDDRRTIPWPPSDDLRNSLAVKLSQDLPQVAMGDCYDAVCNLLDAIGGTSDA